MNNFLCGGYYFNSNFDSGNLANIELIDSNNQQQQDPSTDIVEFKAWTKPDCAGTEYENLNRSWFLFSINGGEPNKIAKINIVNLNKQSKLFSQGMHPVIRIGEYGRWERMKESPTYFMEDANFTISFLHKPRPDHNHVKYFYAFTFPFTFTDCQEQLERFDKLHKKTTAETNYIIRKLLKIPMVKKMHDTNDEELIDTRSSLTSSPLLKTITTTIPASQLPQSVSVPAALSTTVPPLQWGLTIGEKKIIDRMNKHDLESDIYYHRELLKKSVEGRSIDLLTITSFHGIQLEREERLSNLFPDMNTVRSNVFKNKKIIFISSRVHPGETPASFVLNGFFKLILDKRNVIAAMLRKLYVFKIVPILNPDGVFNGCYRSDTLGHNLNRMYLNPQIDTQPSIYAVRRMIRYYHYGIDIQEQYEPTNSENCLNNNVENKNGISEPFTILNMKELIENQEKILLKKSTAAKNAEQLFKATVKQEEEELKHQPRVELIKNLDKSQTIPKIDNTKDRSESCETDRSNDDSKSSSSDCDNGVGEDENPIAEQSSIINVKGIVSSSLASSSSSSVTSLNNNTNNNNNFNRETEIQSLPIVINPNIDESIDIKPIIMQNNNRLTGKVFHNKLITELKPIHITGPIAGIFRTINTVTTTTKQERGPLQQRGLVSSSVAEKHEKNQLKTRFSTDTSKLLNYPLSATRKDVSRHGNNNNSTNQSLNRITKRRNTTTQISFTPKNLNISSDFIPRKKQSILVGNDGTTNQSQFTHGLSLNASSSSTTDIIAGENMFLYIDLHGHASKKGIFMYGNYLKNAAEAVECMLLPRLMSMNCQHFHFDACIFTERNMYHKGKRDGLSKEGSGRVAIYKTIGLIKSYTLESNYNTGKYINILPPRNKDAGSGTTKKVNMVAPKYTPAIFEEVGRALGPSILDLTGSNPISRIQNSEFKTLQGLRHSLRMEIDRSLTRNLAQKAKTKRTSKSATTVSTPSTSHKLSTAGANTNSFVGVSGGSSAGGCYASGSGINSVTVMGNTKTATIISSSSAPQSSSTHDTKENKGKLSMNNKIFGTTTFGKKEGPTLRKKGKILSDVSTSSSSSTSASTSAISPIVSNPPHKRSKVSKKIIIPLESVMSETGSIIDIAPTATATDVGTETTSTEFISSDFTTGIGGVGNIDDNTNRGACCSSSLHQTTILINGTTTKFSSIENKLIKNQQTVTTPSASSGSSLMLQAGIIGSSTGQTKHTKSSMLKFRSKYLSVIGSGSTGVVGNSVGIVGNSSGADSSGIIASTSIGIDSSSGGGTSSSLLLKPLKRSNSYKDCLRLKKKKIRKSESNLRRKKSRVF